MQAYRCLRKADKACILYNASGTCKEVHGKPSPHFCHLCAIGAGMKQFHSAKDCLRNPLEKGADGGEDKAQYKFFKNMEARTDTQIVSNSILANLEIKGAKKNIMKGGLFMGELGLALRNLAITNETKVIMSCPWLLDVLENPKIKMDLVLDNFKRILRELRGTPIVLVLTVVSNKVGTSKHEKGNSEKKEQANAKLGKIASGVRGLQAMNPNLNIMLIMDDKSYKDSVHINEKGINEVSNFCRSTLATWRGKSGER